MFKELLAKNWPTWSAALLVVAIFVAQNKGFITAEQVQTILAVLGIGGVAGAHRLEKPAKADS